MFENIDSILSFIFPSFKIDLLIKCFTFVCLLIIENSKDSLLVSVCISYTVSFSVILETTLPELPGS